MTLATMDVSEAASTALFIILADEDDTREMLEEEYEVGGYTPTLSDSSSAWQEVKYYRKEKTRDGFTAKRIAEYGGEGQGDDYWVVISITDGETTRYFRKDGWYASYDGGSLDGETYEVKPVEKLVTFYEN
jgi:hypothetical protein